MRGSTSASRCAPFWRCWRLSGVLHTASTQARTQAGDALHNEPMSKATPPPLDTPGRLPWRQALAWALLVLALHVLLLLGLGKAFPAAETHRIREPVFVHLLVPTARVSKPMREPPHKPTPASSEKRALSPAPRLRLGREGRGRVASPTASVPTPKASAPATTPVAAAPPRAANQPLGAHGASGPTSMVPPASAAPPAATGSKAQALASARQPDAFGWPPSTQLQYVLSGDYRGPLHGEGSLDWLRDGHNYRVELAGAALVTFSYASTGHIDGNWLAPDRYVERVFTRRKTVSFNRNHNTLSFSAISAVMPLPSHLQDSASIFMQLAHQLTMRPQDFRVGQHMAFEVARPTGTTTWDFIIAGQALVRTHVGTLLCWHLIHPGDAAGLGAEVWLAPALQNLPVQIRLQQSAENFLLFTLRQALQE